MLGSTQFFLRAVRVMLYINRSEERTLRHIRLNRKGTKCLLILQLYNVVVVNQCPCKPFQTQNLENQTCFRLQSGQKSDLNQTKTYQKSDNLVKLNPL